VVRFRETPILKEGFNMSDFVKRYEESAMAIPTGYRRLFSVQYEKPDAKDIEIDAEYDEIREIIVSLYAKNREMAEELSAKNREIAELAKRAELYKLVAEAAEKDKEFAEKLAAKDKEFAEILEEKLAAKYKEFGEKLAASNIQLAEAFAEKLATVTSRKSSDFLSPMRKFFSRKKKHD
jgi:hypothetical protein